jgi:hypothetical protein
MQLRCAVDADSWDVAIRLAWVAWVGWDCDIGGLAVEGAHASHRAIRKLTGEFHV